MKKLVSILATTLLCASLMVGCSTTDGGSSDEPTTTTEAEDTTSAEAGDTTEAEDTTEGGDSGSSGKELNIYGIYKAGDQTWFLDEGKAAEAKATELGAKFTFVDAKMNPEECLKAVDNAISNNADGILICVPDQTMSQAVLDKCNEANIPVIAVDDALEVSGEKIAPWVGIDGYVIGEANGEWMANYATDNNLVDDPECGVMILTMDTVSSCVPRTEGEYDKFTEMLPDFDTAKIYKGDTDGTTDKGNSAATAIITAHPEIKKWLVMSANEESAIGAVRALETAALDADSCVIGLGAYLAKDEWNSGKDVCMKAAAYFSADSIGGASAEMLIDHINNGTELKQETAVPAVVVTPDTYKDEMGDAAN